MGKKRVLVVADDLSGAAEIAGIASSFGLSVRMMMALPEKDSSIPGDDVVVLATDSRAADREQAAAINRAAAWLSQNFGLVFKKTDSALRGHVTAELKALLESTQQTRVLFVPANPSKGRVIREGVYYIDGLPLAQTAFAHDPEFPALTSSVRERFPEAEDMGMIIPDVSSASDIRHWLNVAGGQALLAGAADLFVELLHLMGLSRLSEESEFRFPLEKVVAVCGSTQSSPGLLPVPVAYMPLDLYEGRADCGEWLSMADSVYAAAHAVALAVRHHHLTGKEVAVRLREAMADVVQALVGRHRPDELVIEGGATAFACCHSLGIAGFSKVRQLAPGVVRMCGDSGLHITLKPGSYPWGGVLPHRA